MISTYHTDLNEATQEQLIDLIDSSEEFRTADIDRDSDLVEQIIDWLDREGDWIDSIEADIMDDLENGAWTRAGERMLEHCISVPNIIDYVEDSREERGYSYYGSFDMHSVYSLTVSLADARREAN